MCSAAYGTSSTILNRYGESGQPCLVPDLSGIALSFSPFNLMFAVGLLNKIDISSNSTQEVDNNSATSYIEHSLLNKKRRDMLLASVESIEGD
ncbi:hypothetical protein STEG23_031348, partial [Scotinomys teguina]